MPNRFVRVFENPMPIEGESSIIGFSKEAHEIVRQAGEKWPNFFTERDYRIEKMDPRETVTQLVVTMLGSPAVAHYNVQPPMSDEHIRELGAWCTQFVDPTCMSTLIDDRETDLPLVKYDSRGKIVSIW